jgi:hypothetical protein
VVERCVISLPASKDRIFTGGMADLCYISTSMLANKAFPAPCHMCLEA